jgi:3-phenylpropionate/trans-cinnamate dioxygenase ferredoxin subunit
MGNYNKAVAIGELKAGEKKKVILDGHEILLARVADEYYAVANRCPHLAGDLSTGTLEKIIITCPRHGSQFDIRNGKNVRWLKGSGLLSAIGKAIKSPQDLQTYKVKVEKDTIFIEV